MGSKDVDLAPEGIDHELNVLSWHTLDSLLHNVISILVLDTLKNIGLELFNELSLLIRQNVFKSLEKLARMHIKTSGN